MGVQLQAAREDFAALQERQVACMEVSKFPSCNAMHKTAGKDLQ